MTKGYKYLARMDSDDISMPDRIAKQVNFLENQKNIDVLGGACEEFGASFALKYKSLPLTHDELKLFSIIRCPFIHPTVMFRASIFHSDIRYPTNTLLTEDMALWFILLEKNIIFANLPDILIKYRMDENTIHRRKGLSKAINEVKLRHSYMRKIKSSNFKNFFGLTIRFIFHLLPVAIIKILYKNAR